MAYKPRKAEDDWFTQNERDLIKSLKRERERRERELAQQMKQEETKKRKDLHWMKCPKCGSDLKEVHLAGIKVDQCGVCEGIFLDRGELIELLEKKPQQRRSFVRNILSLFSS